MGALCTIENAPRDEAALSKLSRPQLYRLAMDLGILNSMPPNEQAAMSSMQSHEQAPIILRALNAYDQNPGQAAVEQMTPETVAPPPQQQDNNMTQQFTPPPGFTPPSGFTPPPGVQQPPPPNGQPNGQGTYGAPPMMPGGGPPNFQAPPNFQQPPQSYQPPNGTPPQFQPPQGPGQGPGPQAGPSQFQGPPQGPPQIPTQGPPHQMALPYNPQQQFQPPQGAPQPPQGPPQPPQGQPQGYSQQPQPPRSPSTPSDPTNAGAGGPWLEAIGSLNQAQSDQNGLLLGLSVLLESTFAAMVIVAERMGINRQELARLVATERENIRRMFQQGN